MPDAALIQSSLAGALRLMRGHADGMKWLDISADGFWTSFFAIVVAAPAMLVGWAALANDLGADAGAGGRFGIALRIAMIDLSAWIVPLALLAFVAPWFGIRDRYAPYVIATNWASAIIAWLLLPAALVRMFAPQAVEAADLVSLVLFAVSLFLGWRVTNLSIGKGAAIAAGVFFTVFVASLLTLVTMQRLLGIESPAQISG